MLLHDPQLALAKGHAGSRRAGAYGRESPLTQTEALVTIES